VIVEYAKRIFIGLVAIIAVIFVLSNLFTDPVGSAHFVGGIVDGIVNGIQAIVTFANNL
jgi:hypothetical protein